jgi:hypothetical protein
MSTLTGQWSLQKFGETLKNWSILFENKTANENYSNFLSILNETCDKHIPTKTVIIRPDDKPFMNSSIPTQHSPSLDV